MCCPLVVVCRVLRVAWCLQFAVCNVLITTCGLLVVYCVLFVDCRSLCVVCGVLCDVCGSSCVAACLLVSVDCCL